MDKFDLDLQNKFLALYMGWFTYEEIYGWDLLRR